LTSPDANGGRPAKSVVVMGYRNEATAVAAVRSLVDQVGSQPVELVFVTSGGDRSAELVRTHYPDTTIIESAIPLLPGATRNTGVAATTGAIVAFLEADCVAEPGWVAGRLAAHRAGHRAVASAMTHRGPDRPSAWAAHYVVFRARLPGRPSGPVEHPNPAAHGLSFDRDVLALVGPFDERARIGEDTEAARRLGDMGVGAWFQSSVRTAHTGPQSFRAMVRDLYDRGERYAAVDAAAEPTTVLREAALFVPRWLRRLRGIVLSAWRNGRGERWRIVVSLPWIAIGAAAHLAGYTVAHLRERGR
jgi:GT2 family glycosyltransferase